MKHWLARLFKAPTPLEVLAEQLEVCEVSLAKQLEVCEVSLAKHEQAENFSRAMAIYNRAEISRLRARIAERTKEQTPAPPDAARSS